MPGIDWVMSWKMLPIPPASPPMPSFISSICKETVQPSLAGYSPADSYREFRVNFHAIQVLESGHQAGFSGEFLAKGITVSHIVSGEDDGRRRRDTKYLKLWAGSVEMISTFSRTMDSCSRMWVSSTVHGSGEEAQRYHPNRQAARSGRLAHATCSAKHPSRSCLARDSAEPTFAAHKDPFQAVLVDQVLHGGLQVFESIVSHVDFYEEIVTTCPQTARDEH